MLKENSLKQYVDQECCLLEMDCKMNDELSKKLLDDFPRLFRDRNETSMQRGFECGDGWFGLVYKLAQDIESVARESGLSPDSPEWPQCRQVKTKMGSLRFVVFAVQGRPEMNKRISDLRTVALNLSFSICEQRDINEILGGGESA